MTSQFIAKRINLIRNMINKILRKLGLCRLKEYDKLKDVYLQLFDDIRACGYSIYFNHKKETFHIKEDKEKHKEKILLR